MSHYGFLQIPREFLLDPLFVNAPLVYQHVFMVMLARAAFKPMKFNDNGKIINLQPGQLCASIREIQKWCSKEVTRKNVEHGTAFFKKCGFLGQTMGHKKSLFTILVKGIFDGVGTDNGTILGQSWDIKAIKKEKEDKFKKDDRLDCSHVHNPHSASDTSSSRGCKQTKQSEGSSLLKKYDFSHFDIATYRLPDGSHLSDRYQKAIAKYTDENHEKFLRNLMLCEERWANGQNPKSGNSYEQMLAGYVKNDYAGKEIYKEQNRLYAEFLKAENHEFKISIMKTVVRIYEGGHVKDSVSLEQDPRSFAKTLDHFYNYHGAGIPV